MNPNVLFSRLTATIRSRRLLLSLLVTCEPQWNRANCVPELPFR